MERVFSSGIAGHRFAADCRCLLAILSLYCLGSLTAALAQQGNPPQAQVMTSANMMLPSSIGPGQTSLDVTIPVAALESLRLQVIVPVEGSSISLRDPTGRIVVSATDPATSVLLGSTLPTPIPGATFITPTVTNPASGNWTLRAEFPAAPTQTVALVTMLGRSPLQTAVVLADNSVTVGQPVPLAMMVLDNGQPVTALQPTLSIQRNGTSVATLNAKDSGATEDFDGAADDGIYSQDFTFTTAGTYQITGTVALSAAGGPLTRTATAFLEVLAPNLTLGSVTGTVTAGPAGCAQRLNVVVNGSAVRPGTYAFAATLRGSNGRTLPKRNSALFGGAGTLNSTLSFTSSEIRREIGAGGALVVDPLDVLSFLPERVNLEQRRPAAFTFPAIPFEQFCADPIEIGPTAAVTPTLRSGFIDQLEFALPIRVTRAGSYQVSFKTTDARGVEVGQFGLTRSFTVGLNMIRVTVPANRLQTSDGPFNIESVLVLGGGTSAQASRIATGSTFSQWQFFPTITGDLNGDLSVDASDRDRVLGFRNQPSLTPGDRRDLNRDNKIDLQDAREIVLRACTAPACPRN